MSSKGKKGKQKKERKRHEKRKKEERKRRKKKSKEQKKKRNEKRDCISPFSDCILALAKDGAGTHIPKIKCFIPRSSVNL